MPPAIVERQRSTPFNFREQKHHGELEPSIEIRIGSVKAAIWPNDAEDRTRYTPTFSRLYKDGEQWKTMQAFGRNDLLVLAKVADEAHTRIFELQQGGVAQEE